MSCACVREIKLFDISSDLGSHSADSLWGETIAKNVDSYDAGAASTRANGELPHEKGSQERYSAGAAANAGGGHVIGGKINFIN